MALFGRRKNKEKFNVKEAAAEAKRTSKMTSTTKQSNPNQAMQEAEPFAQAQAKATGIAELRHKDQDGNEITDPDRSNPTRHRMERPLDTIRSFERAIYNEGREYSKNRRREEEERQQQRPVNEREYSHHRSIAARINSNGSNSHQSRIQRNESFDNASVYNNNSYQNSHASRSRSNMDHFVQEHARRPTADTHTTRSTAFWSGDGNNSHTGHYSTEPSSEGSIYGQREHEAHQQVHAKQSRNPYMQNGYHNDNYDQGNQYNNADVISPVSPVNQTSSTYNFYAQAAQQNNQQYQQSPGDYNSYAQQVPHLESINSPSHQDYRLTDYNSPSFHPQHAHYSDVEQGSYRGVYSGPQTQTQTQQQQQQQWDQHQRTQQPNPQQSINAPQYSNNVNAQQRPSVTAQPYSYNSYTTMKAPKVMQTATQPQPELQPAEKRRSWFKRKSVRS